jgi:hypothetical protein
MKSAFVNTEKFSGDKKKLMISQEYFKLISQIEIYFTFYFFRVVQSFLNHNYLLNSCTNFHATQIENFMSFKVSNLDHFNGDQITRVHQAEERRNPNKNNKKYLK